MTQKEQNFDYMRWDILEPVINKEDSFFLFLKEYFSW